MNRAGQVFFEASDLEYNIDLVERDIFIPVIGEMQRYRPLVRKIYNQRIYSSPFILPEPALAISTVKMSVPVDRNPVLQAMMVPSKMPLRRDQWRFENNQLIIMPGTYDVFYMVPYTVNRDVSITDQGSLFLPSTQLKLPSVPLEDSILFSEGYNLVEEEDGTFLVKNGERVATYDRATFTFIDPCPDLTVRYKSRCLAVQELSMKDDLFLELFLVRFILALSSTKAIMKLDGLPIDISLDNLLTYARGCEATYAGKINTIQKWWLFCLLGVLSGVQGLL
jgi:hypothetical protein